MQYAPELFPQIKIMCDESDETGRFWLTGSQQFSMMKNIRESLAGRIGVMEMYGLSLSEKNAVSFENELDFSLECLLSRRKKVGKPNIIDIYYNIWQGGMPQIIGADEEQREEYYNAYVETYLMRDVAEFGGVTDSLRFNRFLSCCAALNAGQLNYKKLAEGSDISQPTAKEWLKLLEGLGVIYLLKPYFNNELKRLTKTPKMYFYDTGLCAHLSKWVTPQTLMNGAANGSYFENFAVIELLKSYSYSKEKVNLCYYRDSNQNEVDILIERNNVIDPLEIKRSANPDRREIKKFSLIDKAGGQRASGGVICMCEEVIPIDEKNAFIPCNLI